jgi:hypothetical protein
MDIGNLGIALVLEDDGAVESRMTLARLAAELDTAFLAIIVYVADPERALRLALEAYCQLHPEAEAAQPLFESHAPPVLIDPFGNCWALARHQKRDELL